MESKIATIETESDLYNVLASLKDSIMSKIEKGETIDVTLYFEEEGVDIPTAMKFEL